MSRPQPESPLALGRDDIWQVIGDQRRALADLLAGLSAAQWQHPSLCAGWTIQDVAAHLTQQQLSLAGTVGMMLHWRGSLDLTISDAARRRAADLSADEIIAAIRGTAGSRRHTFGVTYLETLTDALVHGQDIAIPLDRPLAVPPGAAAAAASRVLTMHWPRPLPATRNVTGFRLAATDVAWSAGDGPEVIGPMSAILLLCAGRAAALAQLSGPGVSGLAARLTPA
jgi:uncharacterized protein (TIGR03083 family)